MKKTLCLAATAIALLSLQPRQAAADDVFRYFFFGDPKVTASGIAVGAASIAGYFWLAPRHHYSHSRYGFTKAGAFGVTTVGCMVVAPMLAAAVVDMTEHRELTSREALGLVGDCVVPVLGSMFWNAQFNAHPEWEHRPVSARY